MIRVHKGNLVTTTAGHRMFTVLISAEDVQEAAGSVGLKVTHEQAKQFLETQLDPISLAVMEHAKDALTDALVRRVEETRQAA